jgi:hypothetical protein
MLHFFHITILTTCTAKKFKFGSRETPLKGRLKIRHYLKYIALLFDTHLEEKALLVPKRVPKAILEQWDYLSTSQVNFNPRTRKCCPVRGVYACVRIRGTYATLAMKKVYVSSRSLLRLQ